MKKLMLFILLILPICSLHAIEKVDIIDTAGKSHSVVVPEDPTGLRAAYLRMAQAYLDEHADFETLDTTFDEYKASSEATIKAKNTQIAVLEDQCSLKDLRIHELERQKTPWLKGYMTISGESDALSGDFRAGLGAGIILKEKLMIQSRYSTPFSFGLGIGWIF